MEEDYSGRFHKSGAVPAGVCLLGWPFWRFESVKADLTKNVNEA